MHDLNHFSKLLLTIHIGQSRQSRSIALVNYTLKYLHFRVCVNINSETD